MTSPLRILLVGDYPADPRLGSAKVYYKLHEELEALGHTCDVMLQPGLGAWPPWGKLRWALGPVVAARAIARRERERGPYDVIDVASAEGSIIGLRNALAPDRPTAIVSRSHGLEHLNYRRLLEDAEAGFIRKGWLRRWWHPAARLSQVAMAARLADRLIVLNAGDREFALAHGWKAPGEIDIIAHGVSARFIEEAPASDAPRGAGILFCGTWDDIKGVRYLAAAFTQLRRERPSSRLTVFGANVPDAAVFSHFPPDVREAVTVVGRAGEAEVMAAYRRHDMLVMPSSYEGFGMVLVEAMSQRMPVIATPQGSAIALVRDGETGLLVPRRSASALMEAMRRLLDDSALRTRLGNAAFRAARTFTWARTAEQTVTCYRAAIASRRRGA
ncbi:MAG TPA: glycosyltransferase family 4 protein [Gemmatimonadaceae bacterium]|nr:glycosyltransferase family 4 protein [Gemmatimonadaceae bacterium]